MSHATVVSQLQKKREVFLLVELDFDGIKKRFATKNISVPVEDTGNAAYFFEGRLARPVEVASRFDFRSIKYSIGSVQVEIHNDIRFQDLEKIRRLDSPVTPEETT